MTKTKEQETLYSEEDEMMVLGCMLTNINSFNTAADSLNKSDFYSQEHQIIFQILKKAHTQGKPADVHLVCKELKCIEKLDEVGGAAYIITLAQYAGTSAYLEEYVDEVRKKSLLRSIINQIQITEGKAQKESGNPQNLLENLQNDLKQIGSRHGRKIPIIHPEERIKKEQTFLKTYRGKKYLGLRVQTIDEFNEKFLGLRGLNLLAAAPNVGKTALTVQISTEVLLAEKDACLVYISLEMSEEQIFRRMLLNLSGLNFRTFVFGSEEQTTFSKDECCTFFKPEELKSIKEAEDLLRNFGPRLQIIDQSTCPYIDARAVINYVEALKQKTKTSKTIVIIDYLQVWPIDANLRLSENESDKWRIGEMKKIRDAMNDDPIIVISEARKPPGTAKDEAWGGDLSDVMGSARGTYTPDVVMLLSQIKPQSLKKLWKKNNLEEIKAEDDPEYDENDNEGQIIKNFLAKQGIALCKLEAPKVRDGMQKFSIILEFHFQKNTFKKIDWCRIKKITNDFNTKTKDLFGNQ